ncbi:hypothetical protein LSUE1_G001256 [Lachnellula suecica]|uniref:Modin n=1 Tax=Lachnellula suecica TaxID=602035 RepID=A0A8T9CH81_9HELO|nr:hypothetical protein LSUE1_G001256 [Lachnellula suecica]
MGFDTNASQNILGLVALLVSLIALTTTVLQVLQQYFSSAEGYRRCAESVMGLWSEGTHRRLVLKEFRVEVVFETPVIFVAPPDNTKGPIPGRTIHYVDGTDDSYTKTRVLKPDDQDQADKQAVDRVHTADDERASWVTLLSTLQLAEKNSQKWDREARGTAFKAPKYQIAVGMQSKTRSWDFIPSSITKPYATSAICHLVEMVAMLGLYWKVFDQNRWNLRAEGNGFILTSTTVHGLGVMVVFAVTGRSQFETDRVIPCNAIKELAFGTVPNIFDDEAYLLREPNAQSLELVFGQDKEVTETLEALGCAHETLIRFQKDHKHIFSVSFEIIGMLGKVFRIRGSNFRMIPNPTMDFWLKKSGQKAFWKITRLMQVFQDKLIILINTESFDENHHCTMISKQWQNIKQLGTCEDEASLSISVREAIHDSLDQRTAYLLSLTQVDVLSVLVAHVTKVIDVLDDQKSPLNTIALANANKEELLLEYYFNTVRPAVLGRQDTNQGPLTIEEEQKNTIWVSLIFRMLCWLLLHDFDKADVKMVGADLKGSRMPVYVG